MIDPLPVYPTPVVDVLGGSTVLPDMSVGFADGSLTWACENTGILTLGPVIDAVAEGMALRVAPLPFPGFRRTIRVIAREGALGDIPEQVADCSAQVLRAQFEARFPDLPEPVIYHR